MADGYIEFCSFIITCAALFTWVSRYHEVTMNTTASHARTYKERSGASTDKFAKIASSLFLEKHLSPPVNFSYNCRTDAAWHIKRVERDSFSLLRRRRSARLYLLQSCSQTTRSQGCWLPWPPKELRCCRLGLVGRRMASLVKRLLPNKSDLQGTALTSYDSSSYYIAATPSPSTPRSQATSGADSIRFAYIQV